MPAEDRDQPQLQKGAIRGSVFYSVLFTDLVKGSHKTGIIVKGRHDQSVVLLMDVQGRLHVHFGVLEGDTGLTHGG